MSNCVYLLFKRRVNFVLVKFIFVLKLYAYNLIAALEFFVETKTSPVQSVSQACIYNGVCTA